VGTNTTSTVQNCYYDKQVCPIGGINGGDVAGSAEGKLTSEITNGTTFTDWISGDTGTWNFAEGLYPRLTGYVDESTDYKMDETDAAFVSASPVFLVATDTATTVKSNFTLSTANGVSWVSGGGGIISIDGNNATLEGDGSTALTASLRGITKSVSLTVDITPPILQNAVRDSGTQITVTLSEPCLNLTKENDGGFLVTKTGTEETYTISGIVQGADASYVVLTVDNMAAAGVKGITVTYTAGANGTITDISGNPLATNSIGVVISPWAPKLDTPGSLIWDTTNPAKATWGAVENASGYTVQLHKDGIASGSPITGITDTYYDFSAVITETDTYTFTVQAIGDGATYSDGDMSSKSPDYSYTVPVYISEAEVNMAVPTAGAAPQTAEQIEMATSNADFTVAGIVWHEALTAGDRFKAGQVYTATVTLTSKNGKEFQTAAFTPTVTGASSVGTTTTAGTELKKKFILKKGTHKLNGIQTLEYLRYRNDGRGDLERVYRQQQFVKDLQQSFLKTENIPLIPRAYMVIRDDIKTDMNASDMASYFIQGQRLKDKFEYHTLEGHGKTIDKVSYFILDKEQLNEIRKLLKNDR
jgi:hypothetical protein